MGLRQAGALVLVCVTACAGVPRAWDEVREVSEAQAEPAHYEQHVLGEEGGAGEAVRVEREAFQRAMRMLAVEIPHTEQPMETGRWVMEGGLQADLVAEVERGVCCG